VTDASLAPEDVGAGRPFPWMCYKLAIDLRIYPLYAARKPVTPNPICRKGATQACGRLAWRGAETAQDSAKRTGRRQSLQRIAPFWR